MIRVFLIAEACNPCWPSVPLEGYSLAMALADRADLEVTLVSHVRNVPALAGDPLAGRVRLHFVDNEFLARPLYQLSNRIRGAETVSWTTDTAFKWPAYLLFEKLIYRQFKSEFASRRYDIVHRLTPSSPTYGSPLASAINVPMVIGPLNGGLPWPKEFPDLRRLEREWLVPLRGLYPYLPYYRATYRRLAAVISGSLHTASEIPSYFRGRHFYVPENGVDTDRFPGADSWTEPTRRFRFVTMGRLVPYKGMDLILHAIQGSRVLRDCELAIIGDGPQRGRLESLVRILGLERNVIFLGWLDQQSASEELRRSQAFVFPSLREYGGAVVLEAMASGLPPIVVEYGGPAEMVTPECGILIGMATRDRLVEELRAAMETLADDHALCRRMARLSIARVHESFSWRKKADLISAIYGRILNLSPQASECSPREFRRSDDASTPTPSLDRRLRVADQPGAY